MSELIIGLTTALEVLVFTGIALSLALFLVLCEDGGAMIIEHISQLLKRWFS